jgi:hypothetical protein
MPEKGYGGGGGGDFLKFNEPTIDHHDHNMFDVRFES